MNKKWNYVVKALHTVSRVLGEFRGKWMRWWQCDFEETVFKLYSRALLCSAQSHATLWNPVVCSPPGSSVCGIPQARILEWVAISSSRESSQPRDRTQGFHIAGGFFKWNTNKRARFVSQHCQDFEQRWCWWAWGERSTNICHLKAESTQYF